MPRCASLDHLVREPLYDSCLVTGRVLDRPLPGAAVAAAMVVDGELWVVVDLRKDDAMTQAQIMLNDPQTLASVRRVEDVMV